MQGQGARAATDRLEAIADLEESEAAARALERENRHRQRLGLPLLDELPPAPSTLGWPKLDPAMPPADDDEEEFAMPVRTRPRSSADEQEPAAAAEGTLSRIAPADLVPCRVGRPTRATHP